jgi:copper resistance protein C
MKFFRIMAGGFAAAALLLQAAPLFAHAFPTHAEPRVGSTVAAPPAKVTIWFDGDIEGAFSKIEVYNSANQRVDKNDARVDPANRNKLEVTLSPLPSGTYHVHWTALSVDTHVTEGAFMFTVGR